MKRIQGFFPALCVLSLAFTIPAQLPPVPVPPGNPITADKVNLGKVLFWDEQLSSSRTVACGSCHIPEAGGTDPRAAGALHPGPDSLLGTPDDIHGSPGLPANLANGTYVKSPDFGLDTQVTGRKAPSAINAAFNPVQFWDGRASDQFTDPATGAVILANGASLEEQAEQPPTSDVEMGHQGRDWIDVALRVANSKPLALATDIPPALAAWMGSQSYAGLFTAAFGSPAITPSRIIRAIATYERTLIADQTPFDAGTLTPQQQQGLNFFTGGGRCIQCHGGPLLTNNQFVNLGVRPPGEDLGRSAITGNPADRGRFKMPGLRNVGLHSTFFHNGGKSSLNQVVSFYARGGDFRGPGQNQDPRIQPFPINAGQRANLLDFLRNGLTDPRVANRLPPFDRPTLNSETSRSPENFGSGGTGTGGFTPRLLGIEPPVIGNPNFTITVADALGGAQAVLIADVGPGSGTIIAGVPIWFAAIAPVAVPLGAMQDAGAGAGFWSGAFSVPSNPTFAGASIFMQAFVLDPAGPSGLSATEGLAFTLFAGL